MQKLLLIAIIFHFISCESNEEPIQNSPIESSQDNQIETPDTISKKSERTAPNFKDQHGLRQGHWLLYGKNMPERGYSDAGKIEEGTYRDGVKDGEWSYYLTDGKTIDSIVTYDMGVVISIEKLNN